MMRCSWILSILILILPACLHKSRARVLDTQKTDLLCSNLDNLVPKKDEPTVIVDQKQINDSTDYQLRALTLEAKLSDIPIPLGSEPINDFFAQDMPDGKGVVLGYTNTAELSSLYEFFKDEYVSLGWQFIGGIQSIESMLTFEKPDRICVISLRPLETSTALIITVCPKDNDLSLES